MTTIHLAKQFVCTYMYINLLTGSRGDITDENVESKNINVPIEKSSKSIYNSSIYILQL